MRIRKVACVLAMFMSISVPLTALASDVVEPVIYENQYAAIEASNTVFGYVGVKWKEKTSSKVKLQITKGTGTVYTYDLPREGRFYTFPFSEGNGEYTVNVFKQIAGTQYTQVLGKSLKVAMKDSLSPFLRPNIYVGYADTDALVKKAKELCDGKTGELLKVDSVYHYVVDNLTYDREKAKTVQSGYIPNAEATFQSKTGICFDCAPNRQDKTPSYTGGK